MGLGCVFCVLIICDTKKITMKQKNLFIKIIIFILYFFFFCRSGVADAVTFKIASYNVENLFDVNRDFTEYPDYIPNSRFGWNREMLNIKLDHIAAVLKDLDADVVCMQEVESKKALTLLQERLGRSGVIYPYAVIADDRRTAVRCAILSKFMVISEQEIRVGDAMDRNILKVTLNISENPLIIYVNHWKSKAGPESRRIKYARALSADINRLGINVDFILIGDFNSDYNEFETFKDVVRLNDTKGITGINHVLHTITKNRIVDESILTGARDRRYLYNLWLELPVQRRWSMIFFGRKNSPDCIIVSPGLYDEKGIAYVDNSFDKFDPDYLFENNRVFRWQRSKKGKGKHLGRGYSDHLPVFAKFTTAPFCFASAGKSHQITLKTVFIKDLYTSKSGPVHVRLDNCAVIYKHQGHAVIKQKNGRAIYIYKAAAPLLYGNLYNLTVTQMNRHFGNMEIISIKDAKPAGAADDLGSYYISDPAANLTDSSLRNEVIGRLKGIYKNGWFHYGKGRKIKFYFQDDSMLPDNNAEIEIFHARIGYHRHPEVVIEKKEQIR